MLLGLITDIHERTELLRHALDLFRRKQVERIVVIGDIYEMGQSLAETCQLLAAAQVRGVWGNHDFGLCREVDPTLRAKYPIAAFDYLAQLQPRLVIEDCHFSHVEPWLDPEVATDLWYFEGPPDTPAKLRRIFAAVPQRVLFAGHFHQWLLATPAGIHTWHGQEPIRLDQGRYFVVIGALCEGRCATYDTATGELIPIHLLRGARASVVLGRC